MIAVHVERKSTQHPSAVDGALRRLARHMVGVEATVAAFVGGRVVGIARGRSGSPDVTVRRITHRQWLGFDTYESLNAAMKGGQVLRVDWRKDISSGWNRQNVWGDYWPVSGVPGAGDYTGTAATARQHDKDTAGALDLRRLTPAGGATRHLVGRSIANVSTTGAIAQMLWLYDRVLTYDQVGVTTSTTTMTNTLTAQRYAGVGEDGLQIAVTGGSVAHGAVAATLSSMTVTDQAGNAGVALTPGWSMAWYTNAPAGGTTALSPIVLPHDTTNNFTIAPFLPLPAGVSGVRKVEAYTSSAINTGSVCVALIKPIACLWHHVNGTMSIVDHARAMFNLPRIFDSACLNMLGMSAHGSSGTANNVGHIRIAHG